MIPIETHREIVLGHEMVLLEPDAFLTQLAKLFERCEKKGTVNITMKRCACARAALTHPP